VVHGLLLSEFTHTAILARPHLCATLQDVDLDLSGSDLAETMCSNEGQNLSDIRVSYSGVVNHRS